MATQLTFYGQAAFKLVTPAGNVLLIDPWIKNPLLGQRADDELKSLRERVDVICLTHGHADHVGESVELGKKTKAKLLCNLDLADAMGNVLGYPRDKDDPSLTGHIGGEVEACDGEVAVRFVPAMHGSAIVPKKNAAPVYAGPATGLVLSVRNGPTIYHTGDTDLFSDMSLIAREQPIDWMLVCMGGHFTMGPERAAEAIALVKPKFVVPTHFGTFPVLKGTPEMLKKEMKKAGAEAKMRVMKIGETLDI